MPSQDVSIKGEGTDDFAEIHVDIDTSETSLSAKSNIYGWDEDSNTWLKLLCDDSGRLITSAFTRPADTLDIGKTFRQEVTKNTIVSQSWTIPNGKQWRIEKFGGGGFPNTARVAFVWDGTTVVREIFLNSDSFEVTINEAFDGDGAKQITLFMENRTNQDNRMFSYFSGFEQ